jgi:hypothetical protein
MCVLSYKGFPGRTTTCMNTGNGYEALGVHGHCITMRKDIIFGLAGLGGLSLIVAMVTSRVLQSNGFVVSRRYSTSQDGIEWSVAGNVVAFDLSDHTLS